MSFETIGQIVIESGRLLLVDPAVVSEWSEHEAVGNRYDLMAWGEDAELLGKQLGLPVPVLLSNVPYDKAVTAEREALAACRQNGWQVAVELRPRSHYWQSVALAGSPSRGGELIVGDQSAVVLAPGGGTYAVQVERSPDGAIARLIIDFTVRPEGAF